MAAKAFERARFVVALVSGPREVEGLTSGAFGTDRREWGVWPVTHLGTGFCVFSVASEARARRAIRALNAMGPWNVTGVEARNGHVHGTPVGCPALAEVRRLMVELGGWGR